MTGRFSLKSLLAAAALALALVPMAGFGTFAIRISTERLTASTLGQLDQTSSDASEEIAKYFTSARNDVLFLAQVPALAEVFRGRARGDAAYVAKWEQGLADLFSGIAASRTVYHQLRYIDETGMERIRVNYDGAPRAVPREELQPQGDRDYFVEATKLAPGAVYVSAMGLNREHGAIEVPHRPVVRYATPVRDGRLPRGILVLNVAAGPILAELDEAREGLQKSVLLVDRDGYYAYHPDPAKRWGAPGELATGERLHGDYPGLAEHVLRDEAGVVADPDLGVVAHHPVALDPATETQSLVLVEIVPEAVALADVAAIRRSLVGFLLLAGGLAGVVGVVFATRITRPMLDLERSARRVAEGDLAARAAVGGSRETAAVAASFNRMAESLDTLLGQIRQAASDLASSSAEIVAATTQQAAGAAEEASAVQETAATVEEVKQTAQLSSEKARAVAQSSQRSVEVSQDGRRAVDEGIAGIQETKARMEAIAEKILGLSEQAQAIGDVISTVNDIAEQSNLLAVNAAIEAAKAGEAGRGFSVVAQEVKALAEQSKQATGQVRQILNEIQRATQAAVMAAEQGVKSSEAGVGLGQRAGESIRVLAESLTESAHAAQQILASAQQQAMGLDQIALAMRNIRQASSQGLASTREMEKAAADLDTLARRLNVLVAGAKASPGPAAAATRGTLPRAPLGIPATPAPRSQDSHA